MVRIDRVAKPADMLAAESRLAELTKRQAELTKEVGKWTAQLGTGDTMLADRAAGEITKLDRTLRQTRHQVVQARDEIEQHRPAYVRAVRAAIAPHRRDAAVRILKALQ